MKTRLLTIVSILALSFLFTQCASKDAPSKEQSGTEKSVTEEKPKVSSELEKASEGINKMCPVNFGGGETRLDKTEVLSDNTFAMRCTLLEDYATELDEKDMEPFKGEMKKMYAQMCKAKEWAFIRKESANLLVTFKNKNGKELFELKITPEDYK